VLAVSDVLLSVGASAPLSFLFGALVGFLVSNRYRLTRRDGD
jgi:hypothetical protein